MSISTKWVWPTQSQTVTDEGFSQMVHSIYCVWYHVIGPGPGGVGHGSWCYGYLSWWCWSMGLSWVAIRRENPLS